MGIKIFRNIEVNNNDLENYFNSKKKNKKKNKLFIPQLKIFYVSLLFICLARLRNVTSVILATSATFDCVLRIDPFLAAI